MSSKVSEEGNWIKILSCRKKSGAAVSTQQKKKKGVGWGLREKSAHVKQIHQNTPCREKNLLNIRVPLEEMFKYKNNQTAQHLFLFITVCQKSCVFLYKKHQALHDSNNPFIPPLPCWFFPALNSLFLSYFFFFNLLSCHIYLGEENKNSADGTQSCFRETEAASVIL